MKNSNEEIDKIIHDALSEEEAQFYDKLGEQSLIEQTLGIYQGRNKYAYIAALVVSIILLGIFVYCGIEFFNAESSRDMVISGTIGFFCIVMIMGIKINHWMQMQTNRVLREMKRLELQIAAMAEK